MFLHHFNTNFNFLTRWLHHEDMKSYITLSYTPWPKKNKNNLHHTSAIELCELVLVDTVINHLDPHLNNRGMWICCLCFSPCTECWQRWRVQKPSETWWKTPKSRHGTIEPRQWWRGTREPTGRETSPANSGCGQSGVFLLPPFPFRCPALNVISELW